METFKCITIDWDHRNIKLEMTHETQSLRYKSFISSLYCQIAWSVESIYSSVLLETSLQTLSISVDPINHCIAMYFWAFYIP